jgi:hypothetical protein
VAETDRADPQGYTEKLEEIMRKLNFWISCSLLMTLAACASTPPAPEPSAHVAQPAKGTAQPGDARVKLDASNIAEAQAAGYKLVTKNGEKLYCRKDRLTGSHLQTKTTCLTEAERQAEFESSRRAMEDMRQPNPPPAGQ